MGWAAGDSWSHRRRHGSWGAQSCLGARLGLPGLKGSVNWRGGKVHLKAALILARWGLPSPFMIKVNIY